MKKATKPFKASAAITATTQLYAAHVGDGRPNLLYDNLGAQLPFLGDHAGHLARRNEWLGYYETAGGLVTNTALARGSSVVPCLPPNPCELCFDYAAHTIQIAADAQVFVPSVESIVVTATVTGTLAQVESIRLAAVSVATPNTTIAGVTTLYLFAPLAGTTDTLRWNGSALGAAYDGYATLNGSPYDLQCTMLANDCEYVSNLARVEVKVHSITIAIGDVAAAALTAAVQELATSLGNDATAGRIFMNSPVFRITTAEQSTNAGAAQYQTHSGEGHDVPLLAKVNLEMKNGTGRRFTQATHGTPILWDFVYDSEAQFGAELTARGLAAGTARTFVTLVSAHKRTTSLPVGRNCHKDIAGAREADGSQFRWRLLNAAWAATPAANRMWAGHTECGSLGGTDAESGITFKTGRMAGDTHRITAFVDVGKAYDVAVEVTPYNGAARLMSNTFRITNWRRIPIVASYKVGADTTELDLAALNVEYAKAAVQVVLANGVATQEVQATWRTHYQTALPALRTGDAFINHAVSSEPRAYSVWYRSYTDYRNRLTGRTSLSERVARRFTEVVGYGKLADYLRECDSKTFDIQCAVVRLFNVPDNGITIFKFGVDGDHNDKTALVTMDSTITKGGAMMIPGVTSRNKGLLMVFAEDAAAGTFIHETGHLLFLSHAPGHFSQPDNPRAPHHASNLLTQPANVNYVQHDPSHICEMGYSKRKNKLCGYCLLKLAGWNTAKFDQAGTVTP